MWITFEDIKNNEIFFPEEIKKLRFIQRGDQSNKKGSDYEKNFSIYKLLFIFKQEKDAVDTIYMSNKVECAAVDDLCIFWSADSKKENYQLKNSPTAGKINSSLEANFDLQTKLDKAGKIESFQHFLVCSNEETANDNSTKMPKFSQSVYFPYHNNLEDMLKDKTLNFPDLLNELVIDEKNHLSALKIISASAFTNEVIDDCLKNILEKAKLLDKTPIFTCSIDFPDWFIKKSEELGYLIQDNQIKYNGWSLTLSSNFKEKLENEDKENICKISSPLDWFKLLNKIDHNF